jgi:pyruvate/2-oxoglutarate dehydrogenase complex dihydrolipoamide acyltransferase (E2) component
MTVTLACDHRIIYGERATGLISALRLRLEEPGTLDG